MHDPRNLRNKKKEKDCDMESETDSDKGLKTHCIYAAILDAGQIYTDQTGRFSVVSSRGNVSIMVLYEYDGNAIMAEPVEQKLTSRGLKPKLMTLDNAASKLLKECLNDKTSTFSWSLIIFIAAMQQSGKFIHAKII
jgi:hypothetical protein